MRATLPRPSKGFWGRSYDELVRLSGIAIRFEGVKGPSGPYELRDFSNPASVAECKLMTDAEIGGFSTAGLEWVPSSPSSSSPSSSSSSASISSSSSSSPPQLGHLRFHGTISTKLPAARLEVQRTGYAAWRTADRPATVFGRALWDVDSYAYLALRVRSDGRSYMINVQTDSMVAPTDLHQHRLFAQRPGRWETIVVPWSDFVRTNHGFVIEPQTELLRQKVRSIGLGLTDRVPGPFELCVARFWATNSLDGAEAEAAVGTHDLAAAEDTAAAAAEAAAADAGLPRGAADGGPVNVPFEPSATPATPADDANSADSGLKNKRGQPVRWDANPGAQSQEQQHR